jgi:Sulfatase
MERKNLMGHFIKTKPLFILFFPIFFVFHGFTVYYDSVPVGEVLWLTLQYIGISILIAGLLWLLYRDIIKASIATVLIMAFHFFFGNFLDFLKVHFPQNILRYRYIFPFCIFIFLLLFIWLKRRKKSLFMITFYLNILMAILIIVDAGWLITKIPSAKEKKIFRPEAEGFTICDTCRKPDIFFIIPDQYAGYTSLKDVFNFDNADFENELRSRGFYIATKSISNYNFTPFSVASTLNMDLLPLKKGQQNYSTVGYSYEVIRNSRVLKFLSSNGYRFYNCSIFDFDDQPAHKYTSFLPYGIKLVTAQTFTTRVTDDFRQDILDGKLGLKKLQKKIAYDNLHFNDEILDLTAKIAAEKINKPKFVYTHLMIPHFPYYFDSKGNPMPIEKLGGLNRVNATDYIEYLQYGNKRLLELIDNILTASVSPPLIIVLSDHGFRHPEKKADPAYDFINLNAVYFPDGNYSRFYDSISNVNQFRLIFNQYFGQRLPMLKDSTTSLRD